jgi:hypothetical protein
LRRLIKSVGLFLTISIILLSFLLLSEKFRFNAIVIHHSASAVDNHRSIAGYHRKARGWSDAAYHLILSNGSTDVALGFLEPTGRYRYLSSSVATKSVYYNLRGIHICVVGDYDQHPMPERLQVALVDVVRRLQKKYWISDDHILFHRDCSPTSCPGRFITKTELHHWLAAESSKCPTLLAMQHEKVIGLDRQWLPAPGRAVAGYIDQVFGLLATHFGPRHPAPTANLSGQG